MCIGINEGLNPIDLNNKFWRESLKSKGE